ncbi:uncharacterized protein LOC115211581 [Argonauta hians]
MSCKSPPQILEDGHHGDSLREKAGVSYQSYLSILDEMTNLRKVLDSYKTFTEKPVKFDACVQTTEADDYEEILRCLATAYDAKHEECKAQEIKLKDSEEIIQELYEKLDKVMANLKNEKEECAQLKKLTLASQPRQTSFLSFPGRSCSSLYQSRSNHCYQASSVQVDCGIRDPVQKDKECILCLKTFSSAAELRKLKKKCMLD